MWAKFLSCPVSAASLSSPEHPIFKLLASNQLRIPDVLTVFYGFPESLLSNSRAASQLRHNQFLPMSFHFIIHQFTVLTVFSLRLIALEIKPQKSKQRDYIS
jgi:hypothetical protein